MGKGTIQGCAGAVKKQIDRVGQGRTHPGAKLRKLPEGKGGTEVRMQSVPSQNSCRAERPQGKQQSWKEDQLCPGPPVRTNINQVQLEKSSPPPSPF